ncbi:hypothetical protein BDZ89DRAFT_1158622 [Hymenopellis radicata]|nr:hypothetical protein BDZ89DRAFT_1158622 [Hymenopellis radicata]
MQNQLNRTEVQAITSAQSLASVQTLLKAGLGCIAFMRELLPNDNFSESKSFCNVGRDVAVSIVRKLFVSGPQAEARLQRQQLQDYDYDSRLHRRGRSALQTTWFVTLVIPLHTAKGFQENGVFDALQKSYLKTFIFAVYLDSKDPNNIIEAYTFNFKYHTLPGTTTTIPVMTLESSSPLQRMKDPVAEAVSKGKLPTLRDVKRSVKTLLKTLITSMTQMDVLPKRRYASFKMFYTDDTPSEYEPPHFQAADVDKDKWYFMTHDLDEVPDKWDIGKVDTGHHAVNVSVTSIATYLPSSTEHDSAPFTGTTTKRMAPPAALTPAEEASLRLEQASKQKEDAGTRNVVWEADADATCDVDADGEDESDFVRQSDGTYLLVGSHPVKEVRPIPVGVRNQGGDIEPIPADMMQVDGAVYGETTQAVPTCLDEMMSTQPIDAPMIAATQCAEYTPTPTNRSRGRVTSPFRDDLMHFSPRRDSRELSSELGTPCPTTHRREEDDDIDTQMLQKLVLSNDAVEDTIMLDMETQVMNHNSSLPPSSIQSFGVTPEPEVIEATPKPLKKEKVNDDVVDCECGSTMEDASSFCEGGCERWYHVWCMGYHSAQDTRLPDTFICFDCRLRRDPSWALIKVGLYPTMLSKFRDLASFRRAIKIAEKYNPEASAQFTKEMGCESNLGRQLFKRLELENFIVEQELVVDDIGFAETRARGKGKVKGKGKQTKARRNMQKSRYVFNYQMKQSKEYADYFNPSQDAESCLLGLNQHNPVSRPPKAVLPDVAQDTQTQDDYETQAPVDLKRSRADDGSRAKKKIKVSIAPAVDLAE